jgi:uncharacterized protein
MGHPRCRHQQPYRLGVRSTVLEADGHGQWKVDGEAAPQLDGCLDVDLEASAFTNALPVHRLLHFEYTARIFGFTCELIYDESGLLLAYPGIATRAG